MRLDLGAELDEKVVKLEEGEFSEFRLNRHNAASCTHHIGVIKYFKHFLHKI